MKEEQWLAHQQDHIRTWLYAVPISNSNKDDNKNWCQKLTLVYHLFNKEADHLKITPRTLNKLTPFKFWKLIISITIPSTLLKQISTIN